MNPRSAVWAFHLALPLLGPWLLLAQPGVDLTWKHPPSHFGLINAVALINVGLAIVIGRAARARHDRLQGLAEPGQVVIGQATYELIAELAEVRALEPVLVKGKLEPVRASVLTGLRDSAR